MSLMPGDIGFRIMGKPDDAGRPIPGAGATTSPPSSSAAAAGAAGAGAATAIATATQDERVRLVRPEVSVPQVREVLLAELLAEPPLQIRVRLLAALSVPVLRPRQQVVPLDLQSYQEAAPGKGGQTEQALLVGRAGVCAGIARVRCYTSI